MAAVDDRPGPSGSLPEDPSTSQTSSISAGLIMPSIFASCTSGSRRNCSSVRYTSINDMLYIICAHA